MSDRQVVEADWTWTGTKFESGVQVEIGVEGRIHRVGRLGQKPTRLLTRQALLPGMVNAHSHAFQRGLRGLCERFPEGAGSFWNWREAMYELVETMDAKTFRHLSVQAFQEMLDAGITAVGEFHYFHHTHGTRDYAYDELLLDSAQAAGVRLVLLNAYYNTGGIGQPLETAQRRFASESPDEYWKQFEVLERELVSGAQKLGVVVHSIRTATLDHLTAVHREATRRGLPFHMHVEEQRREIEESLAVYNRRPMAVLHDALAIGENFTAVHCTHSEPDDLSRLRDAGGTVCVCPLTEGNLGDGIPDLVPGHVGAGRLCLGTDSNVRISMTEEMRWLEYGQRLRSETRGVLKGSDGSVARTLFEAATIGGARALGLEAGRIEAGMWADFFTIDLDAPALAESDEQTLLEAFVFGAGSEVMKTTCVGGWWRDVR